jgi:DNA-binding response OmpR family regulator
VDGRTVLVVEDDAGIRGLLVEVLEDSGYTVWQVDRGGAGLTMAEARRPAIIIVNNHLPDMSGVDMLEQLRDRPCTSRIPVVLVSGRSHTLTGMPRGADRVVPMPFDIDVVMEHVQQLTLPYESVVV